MINVMFDLETWGTTPGSDVRSIGACVFDPTAGTTGDRFYIACDNGNTYGLTRDPRTVQWWSEQSDEARAAFTDPYDLRDALISFAGWLPADALIWSHGAAFDPPILAAAYAAVGLPVPWHYRAPRDTRTLFDLADVGDHSEWLEKHRSGTGHYALDDALTQARAVCAAWERLRIC